MQYSRNRTVQKCGSPHTYSWKNREQTRQLVLYVLEKATDVVVTTSCWVVVV